MAQVPQFYCGGGERKNIFRINPALPYFVCLFPLRQIIIPTEIKVEGLKRTHIDVDLRSELCITVVRLILLTAPTVC